MRIVATMSLIPKDLTPVYKATVAKGTDARRWQRAEYVSFLPPCNEGCPAGENVQRWLSLAQAGRYREAFELYVEENPLPATHGRACYHPCEDGCNRGKLDSPIAIHSVDRFLGDLAIEQGWTFRAGPPTGKRVLVVGAGPGGLSCAYHLRRLGHDVEIRDALPEPGGMLRYGIPAYRLPREIVDAEIARIVAMGVTITCDHRVADIVTEKEEGGFDAVFLALGAHVGNHLAVSTTDASKILDAIEMLESVERGEKPMLGRVVAVVGSGNTAMDAARIAKRLGAEEAVLVVRTPEGKVRAHRAEAEEAFAEGVKVQWLSTVDQFHGDTIKVEKLVLGPDGKTYVGSGTFDTVQADSLVLAVGQHADVGFLRSIEGMRFASADTLAVDDQMGTGAAGIFAGGDLIGGARTMTAAVGHGKRAARCIDAYLRGTTFARPPKRPVVHYEQLNLPVYLDADRREEPRLPIEQRTGFEEVVKGLTEPEVRYEAERCLSCGNCYECDNCYAACPEQAIVKLGKGRGYKVDLDLCTGCAVCYEQCPCHAIEMTPEPPLEAPHGLVGEPTVPRRFKVRP